MIFTGLYQQLVKTSAVTALLATVPPPVGGYAIYAMAAPKTPPVPHLVIHKIDAPPAGQTLNGVSDLIDGELQFDSYANDAVTAQKLSRAVRDALKNYGGPFPDGTAIQFTEVTQDLDGGYEQAGEGYLFRAILRLAAMYTEGN